MIMLPLYILFSPTFYSVRSLDTDLASYELVIRERSVNHF